MAEILKEDAVRNSFIANINLLVQKMTLLAEINNKFTDEEVDALVDLVAYDLQIIIDDLMKGTHNGKRKIDINLITNLIDYKDTMSDNEKLALWSLSSNLVGYTGATIKLIDGTKFDIEFDTEAFSNNDLYHQFNRNVDFRNLVKGTEWLWSLEDITGGITRFVDLVTITESDESDEISNLESITLHVHQVGENKYKEARPVYTWVDFTSALQLVAANINYIMDLLAKYPDFVYYGRFFEIIVKHLNQLLLIYEHMNELVLADDSIYKNIAELKEIYNSLFQIKTLYDNLIKLIALYENLAVLNELHTNLPELNSIFINLTKLNSIFNNIDKLVGNNSIYTNLFKLLQIYDKLNDLSDIHAQLDHIPEELDKILEALDKATKFIDQIKILSMVVSSLPYGVQPVVDYNSTTGVIHLKIPEGKPGEDGKDLVINGSLPSTDDLNNIVGNPGDVWMINGHIWVWNPILNRWEDQGVISIHLDVPNDIIVSDGSIKKILGMSKEFFNTLLPEEQVDANTIFLINDPYEQEEEITSDALGPIEEAMTGLATKILENKNDIVNIKIDITELSNIVDNKVNITALDLKADKSALEELEQIVSNLEVTGGEGISSVTVQNMINTSIATKADKLELDEKVDKSNFNLLKQDMLDNNYLMEEDFNGKLASTKAELIQLISEIDTSGTGTGGGMTQAEVEYLLNERLSSVLFAVSELSMQIDTINETLQNVETILDKING